MDKNQDLNKKTLRIIDGSGFIFRAFYGLPPLNAPDGTPVNAVYGMCTMLIKFLENKGKKDPLLVVFDAGRENFRHEIYPEYKANRSEPPEELKPQFELVRKAVSAFQIPQAEEKGFEADDLIAAYVKHAKIRGMKVEIISSDKDLMQLIDDKAGISMFDAMKNIEIHESEVKEKFGVKPNRVIDIQALAGDSSDNVPGVPSIGPKTAAQLINEYGSLEEIFENVDKIKQDKRRQVLKDHQKDAEISKKLVTLDDNAPMPIKIEDVPDMVQTNMDNLLKFFDEFGFQRLRANAERVILSEEKPEFEIQPEVLSSKDKVEKFIQKIDTECAVSVLTNSTHPKKAKIIGLGIGFKDKYGYIPLNHMKVDQENDLFKTEERDKNQISSEEFKEVIKMIIDNDKIIKISNQLKLFWHTLINEGINVIYNENWDDITIKEYCVNGLLNSLELPKMLNQYSSEDSQKVNTLSEMKKIKKWEDLKIEEAAKYATTESYAIYKINQKISKEMDKNSAAANIYNEYDCPLVKVLTVMEQNGIEVDQNFLKTMGEDLSNKIQNLEKSIHTKAESEFNIASPKQMGEVLFDKMKLPYKGRKTSTGEYATGVDQLERLRDEGYDIAEDILKWREYSKLYNTYIEGLIKEIDPVTKRIYTTYNQTAVNTARLASSQPNLQNIPIRTELGREIRKAFIPSSGYELISVDYSQMELRLMAHIANVKNLKDAFNNGLDIHAATASKVFNVPIEGMDPMTRRRAKEINFGIIYGMSKFGLAGNLNISKEEADDFIKTYFSVYPEIKNYMDEMKGFAKEKGYVETMEKRKIHIPSTMGRDANFMSRVAVNAPIQGTAADIMRKAMINVYETLKKSSYDAKMLLQIHDEIVLEVRPSDKDSVYQLLINEMERVIHLSVPIPAEGGIGKNWFEAH